MVRVTYMAIFTVSSFIFGFAARSLAAKIQKAETLPMYPRSEGFLCADKSSCTSAYEAFAKKVSDKRCWSQSSWNNVKVKAPKHKFFSNTSDSCVLDDKALQMAKEFMQESDDPPDPSAELKQQLLLRLEDPTKYIRQGSYGLCMSAATAMLLAVARPQMYAAMNAGWFCNNKFDHPAGFSLKVSTSIAEKMKSVMSLSFCNRYNIFNIALEESDITGFDWMTMSSLRTNVGEVRKGDACLDITGALVSLADQRLTSVASCPGTMGYHFDDILKKLFQREGHARFVEYTGTSRRSPVMSSDWAKYLTFASVESAHTFTPIGMYAPDRGMDLQKKVYAKNISFTDGIANHAAVLVVATADYDFKDYGGQCPGMADIKEARRGSTPRPQGYASGGCSHVKKEHDCSKFWAGGVSADGSPIYVRCREADGRCEAGGQCHPAMWQLHMIQGWPSRGEPVKGANTEAIVGELEGSWWGADRSTHFSLRKCVSSASGKEDHQPSECENAKETDLLWNNGKHKGTLKLHGKKTPDGALQWSGSVKSYSDSKSDGGGAPEPGGDVAVQLKVYSDRVTCNRVYSNGQRSGLDFSKFRAEFDLAMKRKAVWDAYEKHERTCVVWSWGRLMTMDCAQLRLLVDEGHVVDVEQTAVAEAKLQQKRKAATGETYEVEIERMRKLKEFALEAVSKGTLVDMVTGKQTFAKEF
eukprot:TRINITY_DN9041_c0_g1_i5.p1 TRINITY_DN9041_c0_g1~~TRINITY_DN9041_c0_g1_i5.p1  ORF type:complete len:716 (-),score=92.22 TRINITY_DN9041_c0_g1_i5:133-2226(-)